MNLYFQLLDKNQNFYDIINNTVYIYNYFNSNTQICDYHDSCLYALKFTSCSATRATLCYIIDNLNLREKGYVKYWRKSINRKHFCLWTCNACRSIQVYHLKNVSILFYYTKIMKNWVKYISKGNTKALTKQLNVINISG